ncbi:uncharacterized protein AB675_2886 [Cyphellophora attinorum]|uniref:BTB domain-containing protein n=1 Tax=Cyphellophora attinorum TaxID=1664694 RepID=A0A0N0NJ37_9EURO|nr:uncharacterized protein AB675_2886 [Phialophora attinorum]KPI36468.1 hypothetical protein AB675_2886 [Phialophora attinorum]
MPTLSRAHGMELLKTGQYSDFTIRCGDKTFAVHKNIIALKSEYFCKAIDSGFKESVENEITIQEATPIAVGVMIVFLYLCEHSSEAKFDAIMEDLLAVFPSTFTYEECGKTTRLEDVLAVYLLADRLLVPELRDIADKDIGAQLRLAWDIDRESVSYLVDKVYTTIPSTDTCVRPYLTAWIFSQVTVSRRLSDGFQQRYGDIAEGYGYILVLARNHDPAGSLASEVLLRRQQDGKVGTFSTPAAWCRGEEWEWR